MRFVSMTVRLSQNKVLMKIDNGFDDASIDNDIDLTLLFNLIRNTNNDKTFLFHQEKE